MADPLTPVLAREPVIDRRDLLTAPWVRWLEHIRLAAAMRQTLGLSAFVPASSTAVVPAIAGASVLPVAGLVPAGAKLWCVLTRIDTTFSTANGLTALAVGDATCMDGWGQMGLTAGLVTLPTQMRRGDAPWVPVGYTVLVRGVGGTFAGAGALTLLAIYSTVEGW